MELWRAFRRRAPGRVLRVVAIICVLGGTCAATALATEYTSSDAYFSGDGYNYYNFSQISNSAGDDSAYSTSSHVNNGGLPANYLGVQARGYEASGGLCKESNYAYTLSGSIEVQQSATYLGDACGFQYFYSQGVSAAYNGSGYSYYYTNATQQLYP